MGMIINIDEALKQHSRYNVLREPLNQMMQDMQEAWEKQNPIDLLFKRGTLDSFQETYSSNIGFARAFTETSDYAVGPIFNTAEGFSKTYRSRTFQGGFIITQQTLEDGKAGQVKDDASAFMKRWHGDIVEYAMTALAGGFEGVGTDGKALGIFEGIDDKSATHIKLFSADTTDGKIDTATKNRLFSTTHKTVDRGDGTKVETQSNKFRSNAPIKFDGTDPLAVSKLADLINQVITNMENYRDDNGKRAGVTGQKTIVAGNDARLRSALENALGVNNFGDFMNPAYKRATLETTPYLEDIAPTAGGVGFFIVDKAYNEANHGLEFTERIPLTMDVIETKRPKGITHDARQRFDINCASWRGITYVLIGATGTGTAWNAADKFTVITVGGVSIPVAITSDVAAE
jgi:hypothetical protein